jgi:DNA-binding Lrp family transcriptional regulator
MDEETQKGWVVQLPGVKKELRLDRKDLLILQSLVENARTTLPTLQKITRLSKSSILNRIRNLEKAGIINGYSTLISIHKLGMMMFSIGIKTKMTVKQKEEYQKQLLTEKFINQIIVFSAGRWDFMLRAYAIDYKHFDSILTKITSFPEIIKLDILTVEDWYCHRIPNYCDVNTGLPRLCTREDPSFQKILTEQKHPQTLPEQKIDKKDIALLNAIANDARMPFTKLGAESGLSKDAVKYRIANLIRKGIINFFFANINPYLLGFSAYHILLQVFDRSKTNAIINHLALHPRCTGVLKYVESWNISAVIVMKDITELKNFEEEFLDKFGESIHEYDITQIAGQPHFDLFPAEIAKAMK